MTIALSRKSQKLLTQELNSGAYDSADQVIQKALRALRDQERAAPARLRRLRSDIAVGLRDADAGRVVDGEQFLAALKKRIQSRADPRR